MERGFWAHLPNPIIGLSPMDGVTDHPFRQLQQWYSAPDLMMTEFTSAEGVAHNALRLFRDFLFDESQRPIVAQIFGKDPRSFYITAIILGYLGFDGIDINMGCPAKNVEQHGAGAALIRTPDIAQEIIRQTQQGIQDWANGATLDTLPELKQKTLKEVYKRHAALPPERQQRRVLPLSVKTRVGFDRPVVEEWIPRLLEMEPATISVHGRTLKQLYGGEAAWEHIAHAKELAASTDTQILGNGDLLTPSDVKRRVEETKVDGVLIGRATFGDPWLIGEVKRFRDDHWLPGHPETFIQSVPTISDRLRVALEHCQLYEAAFPDEHFLPMRKHLGWYIKNFPFASDLRVALMRANSVSEVRAVLEPLLAQADE